MFTHTINPIIVQLGPVAIRWYGVIYVFGFVLAYLSLEFARRKGTLNLSKEDLDSFILYLMVGVVVGSRIVHVLFWEPAHYFSHPLEIFMLWKGGLAFHGGLIGSVLVTYWFVKKKGLSFWRFADIIVLPAALSLALGRIGNFINGELWGTVTNVSWCVQFPGVDGCRHPYQIYAAIARFAVFGILLYLAGKKHRNGYLFWMFMLLMGLERIIVDFWRDDYRILLTMGQWLSIGMVIIAGWVLKKTIKPNPNSPSRPQP